MSQERKQRREERQEHLRQQLEEVDAARMRRAIFESIFMEFERNVLLLRDEHEDFYVLKRSDDHYLEWLQTQWDRSANWNDIGPAAERAAALYSRYRTLLAAVDLMERVRTECTWMDTEMEEFEFIYYDRVRALATQVREALDSLAQDPVDPGHEEMT